jgi:hypothetical protein
VSTAVWVSWIFSALGKPTFTPSRRITAGAGVGRQPASRKPAAISGHFEILKKFGPRKGLDDLDKLLQLASASSDVAAIEYLMGLGADPNAVPKSGETALRAVLWSLEWQLDFYRDQPYSSHHTDSLDALKHLLRLGARFHPEHSDELQFLRRCLLKLGWFDGYGLMKCIHRTAALAQNHVAMLFKHPRLRSHLEKRLPALSRLFPVLKKLVGPKRRTALPAVDGWVVLQFRPAQKVSSTRKVNLLGWVSRRTEPPSRQSARHGRPSYARRILSLEHSSLDLPFYPQRAFFSSVKRSIWVKTITIEVQLSEALKEGFLHSYIATRRPWEMEIAS